MNSKGCPIVSADLIVLAFVFFKIHMIRPNKEILPNNDCN